MSLITDSCSLINLVKAGLIPYIVSDSCMKLAAGPVVKTELLWSKDSGGAVPESLIEWLDIDVTGERLVQFMEQNRIGPGEAESILIAQLTGRVLLSDDKRARNIAYGIIGAGRVVGTLGMALELAKSGVSDETIYSAYTNAVTTGAYLPRFTPTLFSEAARNARNWPCDGDCKPI